MRAMTTTRMLLSYFAVVALTWASAGLAAPQATAQAAAQMPKQYTPPSWRACAAEQHAPRRAAGAGASG